MKNLQDVKAIYARAYNMIKHAAFVSSLDFYEHGKPRKSYVRIQIRSAADFLPCLCFGAARTERVALASLHRLMVIPVLYAVWPSGEVRKTLIWQDERP